MASHQRLAFPADNLITVVLMVAAVAAVMAVIVSVSLDWSDMTPATRDTLAEVVHQEVGLSRLQCRRLVDLAIAEITIALVLGETVGISRFGSFTVRRKGQRPGRNPKTGELATVRPRQVIVFRASRVLKRKVNA
jgi:integration host factor subunit alpha